MRIGFLTPEITTPHYGHRNQQIHYPKEHLQHKSSMIKNHNSKESSQSKPYSQKLNKGKCQIKKIMMELIQKSKNDWVKQLQNKKALINATKQQHRQRLNDILTYIQQIKRRAYLQYRHICHKQPCTGCQQYKKSVQTRIVDYLKDNNQQSSIQKEQDKQRLEDYGKHIQLTIDQILGQDKIIQNVQIPQSSSCINIQQLSNIVQIKQESEQLKYYGYRDKKYSTRKSSSHKTLNKNEEKVQNQSGKAIQSRFAPNKKSSLSLQSQKICTEGQDNNLKNIISKYQSQKIVDSNNGRQVYMKISKRNHQQPRRSVMKKKSILNLNLTNKDSDTQQANSMIINNDLYNSTTKSAKARSQKRSGMLIQTIKPSFSKFKVQRRHAQIKKKSSSDLEIDLSQIDEEDNEQNKKMCEIDKGQYITHNNNRKAQQSVQKLTRYRKQKLFYNILKKIIIKGQDIQNLLSNGQQQIKNNIEKLSERKNEDLYQKQPNVDWQEFMKQNNRQYTSSSRRDSVIKKITVFNQTSQFEGIKYKIEQLMKNKNIAYLLKQQQDLAKKIKKVGKDQIIQKFLSQFLQIKDIKRLMKEKFCKQEGWSQKMKEMHQFYIYLQYSLHNFKKKLKKIGENYFKESTTENKNLDFQLDNLILDENVGKWCALGSLNLQTEQLGHKEIQCSMRLYGAQVSQVEKVKLFFGNGSSPHAIQEKVCQTSLKQIQQIYCK